MNRKLFTITLITLLALLLSMGGATGQETEGEAPSQGEVSVTATVNSRISYQGMLKENGTPVTGSRDMTFRLNSDATCSTQVGSDIVKSGVTVTDGLFSVELDVTHGHFNGQGLWLEVEVSGTAIGCQEILPVPYALSLRPGAEISGSGLVLALSSTDSHGVRGETSSTSDWFAGVHGRSTGSTGRTYGVYGQNDSTSGRGVAGVASATSGTTYGVIGLSESTGGSGVYGYADASSGTTYGVIGRSYSIAGRGVYGYASATSGSTYGVYGLSGSTSGSGVLGWANASTGTTKGIYGLTYSSTDYASAVYGRATATRGKTYGVYGRSDSSSGLGVMGWTPASSGVTCGVHGRTDSGTDGAKGMYGHASASNGETYGLYGQSDSTGGTGVYGIAPGQGVYGHASATNGETYGVYGQSESTDYGKGVMGVAPKYGVYGYASTTYGTTYGVYGDVSSDDGWAGYFTGGQGTYSQNGFDTGGGDVAEYFPVEDADLEPGDVVVIDPAGGALLTRSTRACDPAVAGVVTTSPGMRLGTQLYATSLRAENGQQLIALVGRVPAKADAGFGAIQPGDLLTTSPTPGHAMKATDPRIGTILGKALGSLDSGKGIIEVLVMLK